jgi:hypothetical protein
MQTLKLRIQRNYGTEHIYPTCDNGQLFAALLGKKTLTKENLAILAKLGYSWEVETPTI